MLATKHGHDEIVETLNAAGADDIDSISFNTLSLSYDSAI